MRMMALRPYVPQLSVEERDRRWQAARRRMAEKEIDCLVVWGNTISQGLGMTDVEYLTQVGSWHGRVALFPVDGEVTLFSAAPHMSLLYNGYLAAQDWVQDIRPCELDYIELGFHNHGLSSADFPTIVYKPGQGLMAGDGMRESFAGKHGLRYEHRYP